MRNTKDWQWCKRCRQWVFAWSFGVDGLCDGCWIEIVDHDKNVAEAKAASDYLVADYAGGF